MRGASASQHRSHSGWRYHSRGCTHGGPRGGMRRPRKLRSDGHDCTWASGSSCSSNLSRACMYAACVLCAGSSYYRARQHFLVIHADREAGQSDAAWQLPLPLVVRMRDKTSSITQTERQARVPPPGSFCSSFWCAAERLCTLAVATSS